jgi:glucosamine-phosphate N-acetyltransferase
MDIRQASYKNLDDLKRLLCQLTRVGNPSNNDIDKKVYDNIYVIYNNDNNTEIVGCITILIEPKIIHDSGKVAHIEDVVVDEKWRGKGIGKRMIEWAVNKAKSEGCYKVILDCDESNVSFYEKCGFKPKGICMRYDIH